MGYSNKIPYCAHPVRLTNLSIGIQGINLQDPGFCPYQGVDEDSMVCAYCM